MPREGSTRADDGCFAFAPPRFSTAPRSIALHVWLTPSK